MKEYILDTFKIGMSEKEAEKYFSKEIKKMNITERKIYLKNERKYFKFFKILLKRNRKFIIKIREYFEYEISNLFKKEQKMLKKEIININKFNFKFKNMHLKNRKYLEIFLKISYRDAFGYQGMYTIYFPKDKIYINAITDYQFIIIFINNNKEEIIKIAKKCKLFIGLLQIRSNDEEGLESLGRPANEYVKKKFGEDNNSKIKLTTDGIDLSNADVGEKVGDVLLKSEIDAAGGVEKVLTPTTNEKIFKVVRLKSNQEVAVEFYQGVTNKSLWSTIYDATPILGDIKGFHDGLTGKDSITDEKLSFFDRFIRGLPLIGRSVDTFQTINKPMKKGMDSLINLIIDFSKGSSKIDNVNDTTKLVRITEGIGDSSGVTKAVVNEIKVVDNSTDIAKTSKNLEKATDVSEDITKAVAKEVKVIDKSSDIAKNSENIIDSTKNTVETVNVLNKNKDLYYDGRKIYTAKEVNRMGKGADSVSKKGIEYILEPIPTKNINAQNFQSKTAGAKVITDNGVDKNLVPVLLYENRNKRGRNFIKFDGIEVEGGVTSLIDAKTDVPYWSKAGMEKIKGTLGRISEAKKQNPGIKVIYEFPNETAAGHLRSWIDKNNFYDGIVEIRVRK